MRRERRLMAWFLTEISEAAAAKLADCAKSGLSRGIPKIRREKRIPDVYCRVVPTHPRPSLPTGVRCVATLASLAVTAVVAVAAVPGTALAVATHSTARAGTPRTGATTPGAIGGVVRGPDGAQLGRVCVVAVGRAGAVAGVTGPGGRYLITGLSPGDYKVGYRECGRPGRYLNEWYGSSLQPDRAARVQVAPGRPTWLRPVTLHAARAATLRAIARAAAARNGAIRPAGSRPSISGTVTNAAGRGVRGVCVTAFSHTRFSAFGEGTMTGHGGHYSFPRLSARAWTVSFANGCGGKYAPQWWKHASSAKRATPVRLHRGSHVTGIDARLVVGGAIKGTVRAGSTSGPGLAGVCVLADGTGRAAGVVQQTVSHADGSYRISGLGTGSYRLQFFSECGAKGSYLARSLKRVVAVTDGKTTAGVNTFLVPAAEISGTVTAAVSGMPLSGICVFAQPVLGGQGDVLVGIEQTGKNGGYTITGLPHGKYVVNFSGGCGNKGSYAPQYYNGQTQATAANPVTLVTGQHATGIDASMQPGATITGTVTNRANTALAGICVVATSAQDANSLAGSPDGLLFSTFPVFTDLAMTRSAGGYRLANLTPGSYAVSFSSCGAPRAPAYASKWFAPQGGNAPAWLSVRAGLVTSGIGTKLARGGTIAGVVTGATGKPVRGICPFPFALGGQPPALGDLVGSLSATGSNGGYKITGLATGNYAVGFAPCGPPPYAVSWYSGSGSIGTARKVAVTDGQTTSGINQVVRGGEAVSGTVRSGVSGSPLRLVCVAAVDSGGFVDRVAFTSKTGGYRFRHLAAGRYSLDLFPCAGPAKGLANVIQSDVRVTNAALTGVNVTLPLSGSVAGTVEGGNPAAPAVGICVEAIPQTGRGMAGVTISGPGGSYRLGNLASGRYLIRFTSVCPGGSGGFTVQWFSGQSSEAQATPVLVSAGGRHGGVGAALAANGEIAGTVQVSGTPAAGVCVIAYPASGAQVPAVAETGADGTYKIGGLDAGSYDVEFTAGCGIAAYATQWYDGVANRSATTAVAVTAGSLTPAIDAH